MALACQAAAPIQKPEADAAWLSEFAGQPDVPRGLERDVALTRDRVALANQDQLTFRLTIDRDGETLERYLVLEVVGRSQVDGRAEFMNITSTMDGESSTRSLVCRRVRLDLFDGQGHRLDTSEVSLADSAGGMHVTACSSFGRLGGLLRAAGLPFDETGVAALDDPAEIGQYAAAMQLSVGSLLSLISLARDDDLLSDLFWEVLGKPSVLSMIGHMGVDVLLSPAYAEAILLPEAPLGFDLPGPIYSLPVTISLNDEPALFADLLVAKPSPPLTMSTGILALRGQHPTKQVSVRARLVGASYAAPSR